MYRTGPWLALAAAWAASAVLWDASLVALQTDGGPHGSIRLSLDRGAYEEAERQASELYAQVQRTHGPDSIELARASDLLIEALVKNGRAAASTAEDIARSAVRIKERQLGGDHVEIAGSLHNLAAVISARGDFAAALPLQQRGLELRIRTLSADSPDIADSLDAVAATQIALERFPAARESIDRSLGIRRSRIEQPSLALAHTLELLGHERWRTGHYQEAATALDEALATREHIAPAHPDTVSTLTLRGEVSYLGGDILAARATWIAAADLAARTLRPEHPLIAVAKRRLAHGETSVGNISEARRLREDGLRIAERSLAVCDPELAAQLNDLGLSRFDEGDFPAARALYRRKSSTVERCRGPINDSMATAIYNEFEAAREMGANADAEKLGTRAIEIWSKALGATHPFVAYGAYQLATFETSQKKFVRARSLFDQSLRIRTQLLGAKHPDVALTMIPYARMLGETGNTAAAQRMLQDAIAILNATPARAPDALANALDVRASLEARQGDYAAVRASLAESLAAKERIYGPAHPFVAATRADLALAGFALADYSTALAAAQSAEQAGRDLLRFTVRSLPERRALEFAAKRPRGLSLAVSVAAAGRAGDASGVFDSVIRSRGLVLDELAARAGSTVTGDASLAAPLAALARSRERFASLTMRSLQGETVQPAVLADAQKQKEDAEEALAERSAPMRAELTRARAGLADVRHAMPARSALVWYVRYDRTTFSATASRITVRVIPSYIAFIGRADDERIDSVALGSAAALEDAIAKWRAEVTAGTMTSAASPADPERAYRIAGATLRARVWDPIATHLGDVDRVFIVPDGAVNTISFSALPSGSGKYLIESAPVIHYLTTERDLLTANEATGQGLLAVGGPAYGQAPRRRQQPRRFPAAVADWSSRICRDRERKFRISRACGSRRRPF